jgi:integrase/recombinase XerD
MSIVSYASEFKTYLKLERGLSTNSIEAYLSDISKLDQYFMTLNVVPPLTKITIKELKSFLTWLHELPSPVWSPESKRSSVI